MDLHSTATESLVSGGLAMALTYINRKIIHLLTFYKKNLCLRPLEARELFIYLTYLYTYQRLRPQHLGGSIFEGTWEGKKQPITTFGPLRSLPVKENHIGSAVREILRHRQKKSLLLYIIGWIFFSFLIKFLNE